MQAALENREFFLVYQPQYNADKEIIGLEALLRWYHPVKGLLLPSKYIVIAENSGLIVPLGKWVLENAARQYNEWKGLGVVEGLQMTINLSFRQVEKDSFKVCKEFLEIVEKNQVSSNDFELELTESVLIQHPEEAKVIVNSLLQNGFHVAIDDFGMGYSSLNYLRYLPAQRLKIDRSFVNGIGKQKENEIVIEATVMLAKKIGFTVLAEGVETEEQFKFLKKLGCNQFQGYYFNRPLESAAMLEALKKNSGKV